MDALASRVQEDGHTIVVNNSFEKMAARLSAHAKSEAAKQLGEQIDLLPGVENVDMANAIARTALYAAVGKNIPRGEHRDYTRIKSLNNIELLHKGKCLLQSDLIVWDLLVTHTRYERDRLRLSADAMPKLVFRTAPFLKVLGKAITPRNYAWLRDALTAHAESNIQLKVKDKHGKLTYTATLNMLPTLVVPEKNEAYPGQWSIRLNPDVLPLFAPGRYSQLNLAAYLLLGQNAIAKALLVHLNSHSLETLNYSYETLRDLIGSSDKSLRGFRRNAAKALDLLQARGLITSWRAKSTDVVSINPVLTAKAAAVLEGELLIPLERAARVIGVDSSNHVSGLNPEQRRLYDHIGHSIGTLSDDAYDKLRAKAVRLGLPNGALERFDELMDESRFGS